MDNTELTMINNLHKNTGKTLEEWIKIVQAQNFIKHGEIIKYLKTEHGFTHGFANLVAHKSRGSDAGSVENKDELVEAQYKGKSDLKPVYDAIMKEVSKFGDDIEVAPKKAYISLRRNKQFAILKPATKTRFELQLNLKGLIPEGILEAEASANAMCSHKIKLASIDDITDEVFMWLGQAYERAE